MKVLVAGAGPAGLAFAIEAAERLGWRNITVIERRAAGDTPGWGVTLRDQAFESVGLGDLARGAKLEGRALYLRGQRVIDLPNPSAGFLVTMARDTFLSALRERCRGLGIKVLNSTDAAGLSDEDLDGFDLVVGADGAHSALRNRFSAEFEAETTHGANHFAWLGTPHPFRKLTIMVHQAPGMLGWGYRYADNLSTMIFELSDAGFAAAGFAAMSAAETCAVLGRTFSDELEGQPVLAGDRIRWTRYPTITCKRLSHRNVVLIGDAAHTTHYSQGFGTVFAIDDARSLAAAFEAAPDMASALAAYEADRAPKIAEYQATCTRSMRWAESLVRAADAVDEAALQALIAARWPNNAVTTAPMDGPLK